MEYPVIFICVDCTNNNKRDILEGITFGHPLEEEFRFDDAVQHTKTHEGHVIRAVVRI